MTASNPITGYPVDVDVARVEKIPVPKGSGRRWQLHTREGVHLTRVGSPAAEQLTAKDSGPMTLFMEDGQVIGIER